MSQSRWTHRVCESCWSKDFGIQDGVLMTPCQLKDVEPEPCCCCDGLCFLSAIYVRSNPEILLCKGDHEERAWSSWKGVPRE